MNFNQSIKIKDIKINNKVFELHISKHAVERIIERNMNVNTIIQDIELLALNNATELNFNNNDMLIIDKSNNLSVVFAIEYNYIKIITVIDKSNIFIKSNTKIFKV